MSSFKMTPLRETHLQLHPACPSRRSVTIMCAHSLLFNQLDYADLSNGNPRFPLPSTPRAQKPGWHGA